MAKLVVLAAGLLLIAESEASDVGDSSTLQGFLSKNVDHDKFITPNFNRVKQGAQDFDSPKIADRGDTQAAQLLTDNSYDTISLSVFGIGLVSFVTMLGLTLWRALQPATIPTNSGELGLDMPMMEMKSQGPVGWGQQSSQSAQPRTLCYASKEEMVALAESNPDFLGRTIGFWDPFNLIEEGDFWGLGNEATIGYLRHAEIKHGRVAMAAFLGFLLQSLPIVSGEHLLAPYRGYVAGVSPQEQWENVPASGKFQILIFIGMLESYGEGAGNPEGYVHYTKGGLPGYFPPIAGRAGFGQVGLNLFDPFNWFDTFYPEKDKARGRQVEINNGRLAMLGIFSLLAESAAPGAVPPLTLLNYIIEASGITGVNIPVLDVPLISSYPTAGTGGVGAAWSQFDVFSSLPYWQK